MFKFQIGEMVCMKVGVAQAQLEPEVVPQPFQIVGRLREECHGGTQLHYILTGGKRAAEMELQPYGDDVRAMVERHRQMTKWYATKHVPKPDED